jgi:hypothetical protein
LFAAVVHYIALMFVTSVATSYMQTVVYSDYTTTFEFACQAEIPNPKFLILSLFDVPG